MNERMGIISHRRRSELNQLYGRVLLVGPCPSRHHGQRQHLASDKLRELEGNMGGL